MSTDKYNYNYANNNNDTVFTNNNMVVDGHYTCQQERTQILNERISQRNIPGNNLEPSIGFRPVMTKYAIMPIVDQKAKSNVSIPRYPAYSPHKTYNVGNRSAPWSGFASNVNVESTLRNQFFALQKCDQSEFVPSTNSDLYGLSVPIEENKQTHPLLFKQDEFHDFNPSNLEEQQTLFNNFTRQQLLNSCSGDNNNKTNNKKQ